MAGSRKRPAIMFYTGDWLKDPALGMCSPGARGVWMDLLCLMHENGESGEISGPVSGLSRACRCTPEELESALSELEAYGVCPEIIREKYEGRPENVTVVNRRMARESESRKSDRGRKKRERERQSDIRSRKSPENVTPPLSVTSSIASSVTEQKTPIGVSSGSLFGEDGSRIDWTAVIARWNKIAKAHDRPRLSSLNDTRRKHYKARLKTTPNFWEVLEREIPELGEHARAAKNYCTFPWLISSQEKLDKLAEGNYRDDDRQGPTDVDPFFAQQAKRKADREKRRRGQSSDG